MQPNFNFHGKNYILADQSPDVQISVHQIATLENEVRELEKQQEEVKLRLERTMMALSGYYSKLEQLLTAPDVAA